MTKENFNRIMAGLEDARRHAAGEDVPGMVINTPILPSDDNLVPITTEEAAQLAAATGHVMVMHRDGQMFRVTEPWERGDEDPKG